MPKIVKNEDIYRAVIQVVSERGYAGATTRQMADAANVSEVTLFRKYDNKLQLVRQAINALIGKSRFPVHAQYTGDLQADLLRVVQMYQQTAVKHGQFIFMLLAELPRDPELVTLLDAPLGIFAEIGQLLSRYQREGRLYSEHPMHALSALLGPLIYVSMIRKAMGEDAVPPFDLELHIDHFLKGRQFPDTEYGGKP